MDSFNEICFIREMVKEILLNKSKSLFRLDNVLETLKKDITQRLSYRIQNNGD
jgi:hypothetical protein